MKKLSVLLTLLLLTGVLVASTTTYSSRTSFYAANPGVTIEGWDTLASGTLITVLNGITYTTNDGTALVTNAFLPLSPPNTLGENVNGFFLPSDTMTFTFPSPITAFGISINTFDTSTGGYTATDNLGNVIGSFYDPFPGFTTGEFVGYTSTIPFDSVTIAAPGGFSYLAQASSVWRGYSVATGCRSKPFDKKAGAVRSGFLVLGVPARKELADPRHRSRSVLQRARQDLAATPRRQFGPHLYPEVGMNIT